MRISRHLAVAMENCDLSGLNDEDTAIVNRIDFDFVVIDWAEDSQDINGVCALTGLHNHCVEIEVLND